MQHLPSAADQVTLNPGIDMTPQPLDFVVIGAQKCATSWLYYCLRDHPQICVPSKKLEAGYIGGRMCNEMGLSWFFDRFSPKDGQIKGDVSVEYLWDSASAEALKPHAPSAKLIISLRNPVDRMISGYFWMVRRGDLPNIPIEAGIAEVLRASPGFAELLEGKLDQAVRRSIYAPQIQHFIDVFGPDRIKVILYEDIADDSAGQIRAIYRHLGVDETFVPPSLNTAPKKNSYNRWLLAIENASKSKAVAKLVNYAHQVLTYWTPRKEILSDGQRRSLNRLFAPAVAETIAVLRQLPPENRPPLDRLAKRWKME